MWEDIVEERMCQQGKTHVELSLCQQVGKPRFRLYIRHVKMVEEGK